jgi:hypothetical protein
VVELSVRNLKDGGFSQPLREFDGKLNDLIQESAQYADGREGTRVNLNFIDLDNIKTAPGEVYILPTAVVSVSLSDSKNSMWGYFGTSLVKLMPEDEDIEQQKGKRMHLVMADGLDGRPSPENYKIYNKKAKESYNIAQSLGAQIAAAEKKLASVPETEKSVVSADIASLNDQLNALGIVHEKGLVPTAVWLVTELEGAVPTDASDTSGAIKSTRDVALELIIGKDRAAFNKAAIANPVIKKDVAFIKTITDKSFITSALQLGELAEVNGIFKAGPKAK